MIDLVDTDEARSQLELKNGAYEYIKKYMEICVPKGVRSVPCCFARR